MEKNIIKSGRKLPSERRGSGEPPKLPPFKRTTDESASMLAEDTVRTEWERRVQEQAGEGHYGKVNTKERHEDNRSAPEGELQNDIAQHPLLNKQNYDGADPNVSPEPPLNSEARREFDNAKRLQHQKKMELQKQLTDTPEYQPSSTPTPRPGG